MSVCEVCPHCSLEVKGCSVLCRAKHEKEPSKKQLLAEIREAIKALQEQEKALTKGR